MNVETKTAGEDVFDSKTVQALARQICIAEYLERHPGSAQKDAQDEWTKNATFYRRVARRLMKRLKATGYGLVET